jgi:hypothetical protein
VAPLPTLFALAPPPPITAVLKPPEPQVAIYASQFIRIRAWGILSALVSFVAAGTYRGVKDTVTPLQVGVAPRAAAGLDPWKAAAVSGRLVQAMAPALLTRWRVCSCCCWRAFTPMRIAGGCCGHWLQFHPERHPHIR